MVKTYMIVKRGSELPLGILGCVDAHSKNAALKKAANRFKIPAEKLVAFFQPE